MDANCAKQLHDVSHEDSCNENIVLEEGELSEDSTISDADFELSGINSEKLQHILDKSFSLDDELLDTPLLTFDYKLPPKNENLESGVDFSSPISCKEKNLCSILRRGSCFENKSNTSLNSCNSSSRRVSFPSDDSELASYLYPEDDQQTGMDMKSSDEVLEVYENSCKHHKTIELDIIKNQIAEIKNNINHSATFNLCSINLTNDVNETLEDLLKVTNFQKITLSDCKFTSDTISEFLDMLEYYESTRELEVSVQFESNEAWQSFCNACMNLDKLEVISFKGVNINEEYMRKLLHAVKINSKITTLKFDGCDLDMVPSFYLVDSLKTNTTLRELYLPSSKLYSREAQCLGSFLQVNMHLNVLDISNNFIGDRGLDSLARGLVKQNVPGSGLSVLIVFNNQLTEKSGPVINNIIKCCKNLHTLNVGYNNLTDQVLMDVKDGLTETHSLEGLGLQCTLLTCKGIFSLAEAIEENKSLLKINLKGNKAIQVYGLERLCNALTNSRVIKIEIDDVNRSCSDPSGYVQLVKRLNAICTVNKSFATDNNRDEELNNISRVVSRKVSLSCEPRFLIPDVKQILQSPIQLSTISPSTPKSRFQIISVPENSPRSFSRFKVTPVISPSPEDDDIQNRFANVRSSVSSNESMDSLMAQPDLVGTDCE
ncbi:protein phosphatase 1 regulatory subunit 37-like [Coccinella septempunctata]|uniref:protein phosphatase 1 regulatory subunit 37-like n=1 Tax=Coccinella septempunctata TaxID=41139 RepID=UPI001D06D90F|nr:protein phosphatase 1 regulatory subunit 37-like [Coccinella septempunctata]XP_044765845.1 protein phosphatase 1 regulatory subunit 37-like [Coccinella septempunctata]